MGVHNLPHEALGVLRPWEAGHAVAGVTVTRQELAGAKVSILPPPPPLTGIRDQRPKEATEARRSPGWQPLFGLLLLPQPGSPRREQEMGVGEPGCSSPPLLGGAGCPTRRCRQNCHPAAGLVPGFPWLTHPGLAVPQPSRL